MKRVLGFNEGWLEAIFMHSVVDEASEDISLVEKIAASQSLDIPNKVDLVINRIPVPLDLQGYADRVEKHIEACIKVEKEEIKVLLNGLDTEVYKRMKEILHANGERFINSFMDSFIDSSKEGD